MKPFKRAVLSVKKSGAKFLTLTLLTTLLGATLSGAISVHTAVRNIEENIRRGIPPILTLSMSPSLLMTPTSMSSFEARQQFLETVVYPISQLPYVEHWEYSLLVNLHGYLQRYEGEFSQANPAMGGGEPADFTFHRLTGFSSPEISYLVYGNSELEGGRVFLPEELEPNTSRHSVAILTRELAVTNNLWVGDEFTLFTEDWNTGERIEFTFEVIGIRSFIDRQMEFSRQGEIFNQEDRLNRIFAPYWMANEIEQVQYEIGYFSHGVQGIWPHFILSDVSEIRDFIGLAEPYLGDEYVLEDYSQRFAAITNATQFLADMMDMMLWGAIGAATVIFTLLLMLFLRDRKSEMGIYLALGEKKTNILRQFLTEILFITLIGLTAGLFIGNLASERLTQTMVRNEFLAYQEQNHVIEVSELEFSFGFHELTADEMLEAFDASLSEEIVGIFFLASFAVVVFSGLLPTCYMLKMNPKGILEAVS